MNIDTDCIKVNANQLKRGDKIYGYVHYDNHATYVMTWVVSKVEINDNNPELSTVYATHILWDDIEEGLEPKYNGKQLCKLQAKYYVVDKNFRTNTKQDNYINCKQNIF